MFELKRPLPKTSEQFEQFAERIFDKYEIPETDSLKGTLATMIMHLGPTEHEAHDSYFAKALKKQLANDTAYAKIRELNDKIKAEALALEAQKAQEAKSEANQGLSDESIPVAPV